MSIIFNRGIVDVTVPPGERIAISAIESKCIIYYSTSPESPEFYYEQSRLTNGSTEIGPITNGQKIRIESLLGTITYDIGFDPATDQDLDTSSKPVFAAMNILTSGEDAITVHSRAGGAASIECIKTDAVIVGSTTNHQYQFKTNDVVVGRFLTNGDFEAITGNIKVQANKVIGAQAASVGDATGGATVDAEARTALNDLLAKLRAHGLIAT